MFPAQYLGKTSKTPGSVLDRHNDLKFSFRSAATHKALGHKLGRLGTINNTGWQNARAAVGLAKVRVHDLRHTYGKRLRDAGVNEEDQALLLGHAIEGMPQHYATATVARLVDAANKVAFTVDRTTLLRVVNG